MAAVGPFQVQGDDLVVGGLKARALAERFGTPIYVYDAGLVEERYRALRSALPAKVSICYALKANPSLAVSALLARLGAGAEAASRGELLLARRAGFAPESVVMAGPAKTEEDHLEALRMRIRAVHVESMAEMLRLNAAALRTGAAREGNPVPFGLRVNTIAAIEEDRSIIGGAGPRKFGVDEEEVAALLDRARECKALRLSGLHVFNASNVRDAGALVANASRILALASSISADAGQLLDYVDLGGGLGIPYAKEEAPLDVAALGRGIAELLEGLAGGPLAGTSLIVEPGRYLVGEAGIYLTRVVEVKVSRGKKFALVDGGIHHFLRPALLGVSHPIVHASRASEPPEDVFDIGGPLCTGLDFLGKEVVLPELSEGDLLAILCAGAYGYTESMLEFLSHAAPAEVVVRGGEAAIARPRTPPEDRLDRQTIPPFLLSPSS